MIGARAYSARLHNRQGSAMGETKKAFEPPAEIGASAAWDRLEEQLDYYGARASRYQAGYKRIKLALIAVSAAIPILAFAPLGEATRYVVAAAGVAIALLEGLLLLNQYGELWVKYRHTAEGLKRERSLLLAGAGDYRDKPAVEALRLLAERTEAIIAQENQQWTEAQSKALAALAKTQDWTQEQLDAATARAAAKGG